MRLRRRLAGPEHSVSRTDSENSTGACGPLVRAFWEDDVVLQDFRNNGWAFVSCFLEPTFHRLLMKEFPARRFFRTVTFRSIRRTYDEGILATPTSESSYLRRHHALALLYDEFFSDRMRRGIQVLAADTEHRACVAVQASDARWGSGMAPHQDTQFPDPNGSDHRISILYYVRFRGWSPGSGVTQVLADNTFDRPLFVPPRKSNSALVFASGLPRGGHFFHGVAPLGMGSRRWAISVGFAGRSEIER